MTRTTYLKPEEMSSEQRAIYDEIVASRGTWLNGPFAPMLHQPRIADPAGKLGEFVRYNTSLEPVLSELAIIMVARHNDCSFEWYQHKKVALSVGVPAATVDAVARDEKPQGLDQRSEAVWNFTHELLEYKRVSDATYNAGKTLFGEVGMVELVAVIGYYNLIAMTLNAHEVPLPAGVEPEMEARHLPAGENA